MTRLLALLALLLPGALAAETVKVRSGEHADFSRLVFGFEGPADWTLSPADDGYRVAFSRENLQFDLSRVFYFIPRDRLEAVSPRGNGVDLTLACDCAVEVFAVSPTQVAVDIRDGPPRDVDPAPAAAPGAGTVPPASLRAGPLARPPLPVLGSGARDLPAAPLLPQAPADMQNRLQDMQAALLEQLGRAASQGLLTPRVAPPPGPAAAVTSDRAPDTSLALPSPQEAQIRVETAVDRDLVAAQPAARTTSGQPCFPAEAYALNDWGRGLDPATLIATMRDGLLREFDKTDPAAVQDLARAYLYLGFGAEARAVLRAFGQDNPEAGHLLNLSRIVDGRAVDAGTYAGQIACDSPVALWAILALPALPQGAEIDADAVQRAFSALPLHLRRHLGPDLARRFLEAGDRENADRLRNAIQRAPGDHGGGVDLMQARIEIAQGDDAGAERRLDGIVKGDSVNAPDALALKLETRIEAARPPDPGDLDHAAALAFERRDTALGHRLRRALTLGHALRGEFVTARRWLDEIPAAAAPRLPSAYFEIVARTGTDAQFLAQLYTLMAARGGLSLFEPGLSAVVKRLSSLGFADRAEDILTAAPVSAATPLLRAEIALARGRAGDALDHVAGRDGPEAGAIRQRAESLLADSDAGLAPAEVSIADLWAREAWADMARAGTAAQKALAEDRLEPSPGATDPSARRPLAETRTTLTRSATLRAAAEQLLAAPERSE